MKNASLIAAATATLLMAGCLSGCTGAGDRVFEIKLLGGGIEFRDTIPLDENGKKEYRRGFDPFAERFIESQFNQPAEPEGEAGGD